LYPRVSLSIFKPFLVAVATAILKHRARQVYSPALLKKLKNTLRKQQNIAGKIP